MGGQRDTRSITGLKHVTSSKLVFSLIKHSIAGGPVVKTTKKNWKGMAAGTLRCVEPRGKVGGVVFRGGGISNFCVPMLTMTGEYCPCHLPAVPTALS